MPARLHVTVACALVVVLLGGGCATHVPVSESVLFHDRTTLPSHTNNWGFGVTATMAPTLAPALTTIRKTYPNRNRKQERLINGRKAGGGFFVASYDEEGDYAFSATLGFPVVGFDATLKIRGRNYLTVGYSAPNQGQVFLQHRAFNSPRFGAAVGVGGRYERYAFGGDHLFAIEEAGVASVGTQLFGVLREKMDQQGGIKFGTYAGYAPRLDCPVVSLTVTLGTF